MRAHSALAAITALAAATGCYNDLPVFRSEPSRIDAGPDRDAGDAALADGAPRDGRVSDAGPRWDAGPPWDGGAPRDAESWDGGMPEESCDWYARARCEWMQRCEPSFYRTTYGWGFGNCWSVEVGDCRLASELPGTVPISWVECGTASLLSCASRADVPECAPRRGTLGRGEPCLTSAQCGLDGATPLSCNGPEWRCGMGTCEPALAEGESCREHSTLPRERCDVNAGFYCLSTYDEGSFERRGSPTCARLDFGVPGDECGAATHRDCDRRFGECVDSVCRRWARLGEACDHVWSCGPLLACGPDSRCIEVDFAEPGELCTSDEQCSLSCVGGRCFGDLTSPGGSCAGGMACPEYQVCEDERCVHDGLVRCL